MPNAFIESLEDRRMLSADGLEHVATEAQEPAGIAFPLTALDVPFNLGGDYWGSFLNDDPERDPVDFRMRVNHHNEEIGRFRGNILTEMGDRYRFDGRLREDHRYNMNLSGTAKGEELTGRVRGRLTPELSFRGNAFAEFGEHTLSGRFLTDPQMGGAADNEFLGSLYRGLARFDGLANPVRFLVRVDDVNDQGFFSGRASLPFFLPDEFGISGRVIDQGSLSNTYFFDFSSLNNLPISGEVRGRVEDGFDRLRGTISVNAFGSDLVGRYTLNRTPSF